MAIEVKRPARRRLLIAVAAIIVVGLVLLLTGALGEITDTDRLKRFLTESGAWGPVAFVVAFCVVHIAGPVAPLLVAAGGAWSTGSAIAIGWLASVLASTLSFGLARWVGKDWAARRVPQKFLRYEERLAKRGFLTVLLLRATIFMPPPLDWLFGVSPHLRVRDFLAGTAIGIFPPLIMWVVAGGWIL